VVRLIVCVLLTSATAHATHDDAPATDYTAYTLRDGEYRAGPGRFEWGVTETVDLGTLTWLWYVRAPNAHVKWRFWDGEGWAVAASLGVASFNLGRLVPNADIETRIIPFELLGSWRSGQLTYSLGFGHTLTRSEAGAENEESGSAAAALDLSVGYLHPTLEWRRSATFAWVLESRIGLFQQGTGDASSEVEVNERTKVEIFGAADADISGSTRLVNVSLGALWSWDQFNLRAGLGYGNYSVPGVNIFIPEVRFPYPELAAFWRF